MNRSVGIKQTDGSFARQSQASVAFLYLVIRERFILHNKVDGMNFGATFGCIQKQEAIKCRTRCDGFGPKLANEPCDVDSSVVDFIQLLGAECTACCTVCGRRGIDELSGHTTGRLGYIGPATVYAFVGTAQLALRCSVIQATSAGPYRSTEDYGLGGAVGGWATPRYRRRSKTCWGAAGGQCRSNTAASARHDHAADTHATAPV